MAQAVAFAHSRGIVHRDLKPHQVVVGEFGEVILMDWGLALCVDRERLISVSSGGLIKLLPSPESAPSPAGTPAYMAPEQVEEAASRVTEKTDIFLLGSTLYHVLTGLPPRWGMKEARLRQAIESGYVVPPDESRPGVHLPEELIRLVRSCMHPAPEMRLPSALDFLKGLEDFLSGAGRRAEAASLTKRAAEMLPNVDKAGYNVYTEVLSLTARAMTLNPANIEASLLRDSALTGFIRNAISHGDLILARVQLDRMERGTERDALASELAIAETRTLRRERTRKTALASSAVLLLVLTGGTLVFNRMLSNRSEEAERQRAIAVQTGIDLERELYKSSVALALRLIDGNTPHLAREQLEAAPSSHRDLEWGLLRALAETELRVIPLNQGPLRSIASSSELAEVTVVAANGALIVVPLSGSPRVLVPSGVVRADYTVDGYTRRVLTSDSRIVKYDENGKETGRIVVDKDNLSDFVSEGDDLILVSSLGELLRMDGGTGNLAWTLPPTGPALLYTLAIDVDRGRIAVGRPDFRIQVLDSRSGESLVYLTGHVGTVTDLEFLPNGSLLSSSADTTVRLWDIDQAQERLRIFATTELDVRATIHRVVYSQVEGVVLTGGADAQALIWDPANASLLGRLSGHSAGVTGIALLEENGLYATISVDGNLRFWNARRRGPITLQGHAGRVVARGFPNADSVVTMANDNTSRLWKLSTGEEYLRIRPPFDKYGYCDGRISADGRRLALTSRLNKLHVYQLPEGTEIATAAFPAEELGDADDAAISPDGRFAAIGGPHGCVIFIDVDDPQPRRIPNSPDSPVMALTFSPDSASLAVAYHTGLVRTYSTRDLSHLVDYTGHRNWVEMIAFSSDGKYMATASFDTTARLWDVAGGATIHEFIGHTSWLTDVAFSHGNTRVITSSADGTIRVWDVVDGSEVIQLNPGGGIVDSVGISPNGDFLVATFRSKDPEIWEVAPWNDDKGVSLQAWLDRRFQEVFSPESFPALPARLEYLSYHAEIADHSLFAEFMSDLPDSLRNQYSELLETLESPESRNSTISFLRDVYTSKLSTQSSGANGVIAEMEAMLAPFVSPPLRPYRATPADEANGRLLRVLLVVPEASNGRAAFINGNRPEIGNWTPNLAEMTLIGNNEAGEYVWEFALSYRPMDFKFTHDIRGGSWGEGTEWEGPPNRQIDSKTQLYVDRTGAIIHPARFGYLDGVRMEVPDMDGTQP